jgi:hypothetical protein
MYKKSCRLFYPLLILFVLMIFSSTAPAQQGATIFCKIDYLQAGWRVFPIAELIDLETARAGELTLEGIMDFFSVTISASNPDDREIPIYIHVWEDLGGERLINFVSSRTQPFTINQWMSVQQDGVYTNSELAVLEEEEWFYADDNETYHISGEQALQLVEGQFLAANLFTIGFSVYNAQNGQLITTFTRPVQVYNPSSPELREPTDQEEIDARLPFSFQWDWVQGQQITTVADWTLKIVEGPNSPGSIGVIEDAPPSDVIYDSRPTSTRNHLYTGDNPGETPFVEGNCYHWMVEVAVNSIVPGRSKIYSSPAYSFCYGTPTGEEQQGEEGEEGGGVRDEDATEGGGETTSLQQVVGILARHLSAEQVEYIQAQTANGSLNSVVIEGRTNQSIAQLAAYLESVNMNIQDVRAE